MGNCGLYDYGGFEEQLLSENFVALLIDNRFQIRENKRALNNQPTQVIQLLSARAFLTQVFTTSTGRGIYKRLGLWSLFGSKVL